MNLSLMKKCLMVAIIATIFLMACEPRKTKQIAVVYDQSKSKIDGCDCLAGVLEKTLRENSREGAKITFFKLGEPITGFEPKVVEVYELPKNRRKTEGKSATIEKMKAIVMDFQTKCRTIERTNDTPLVQAVSKIVGFLKQNGCDEKSGCQVLLQTDLQESVQKPVFEKISDTKTSQETQFDNAGIAVTFFGVAEVEEKKSTNPKEINQKISNAKQRNELKDVWRDKFVDQNLVKFFDFCTFESSTEFMTEKD